MIFMPLVVIIMIRKEEYIKDVESFNKKSK